MRAKRVLIDTFTGKFFMVGPGGYELKLSPGSEAYDTEDSQAGHMMLPCSQFREASRQGKEDVLVFHVGDYFSPTESKAAGHCRPDPKAERRQKKADDAKTFL